MCANRHSHYSRYWITFCLFWHKFPREGFSHIKRSEKLKTGQLLLVYTFTHISLLVKIYGSKKLQKSIHLAQNFLTSSHNRTQATLRHSISLQKSFQHFMNPYFKICRLKLSRENALWCYIFLFESNQYQFNIVCTFPDQNTPVLP